MLIHCFHYWMINGWLISELITLAIVVIVISIGIGIAIRSTVSFFVGYKESNLIRSNNPQISLLIEYAIKEVWILGCG